MLSAAEIQQIQTLPVKEGLSKLCELIPEGIVFSTSLGQEDQVLTDMIFTHKWPIKVFTLDTGRLFNAHYELLENNDSKYQTKTQVYFPNAEHVENYVNEMGINSFYQSVENRKECCFIRKVEPLNRALEDATVWITGLRSEQSVNRSELSVFSWDAQRQLYKYNPVLHWSYEDVLAYIKEHSIMDLDLHRQGYISIGCEPCTRPIEPGEDPRAGRWWWEESKKECGLHLEK